MTIEFFNKFTEILAEAVNQYTDRIEELEDEGMSQADSQEVAGYEHRTKKGKWGVTKEGEFDDRLTKRMRRNGYSDEEQSQMGTLSSANIEPEGYAERVAKLEAEGLTTSDAQAEADAFFGLHESTAELADICRLAGI